MSFRSFYKRLTRPAVSKRLNVAPEYRCPKCEKGHVGCDCHHLTGPQSPTPGTIEHKAYRGDMLDVWGRPLKGKSALVGTDHDGFTVAKFDDPTTGYGRGWWSILDGFK